MTFFELLLLAIGLSMDAFAVAVCKGLAAERVDAKRTVIVGLWFGGFQALMPAIGCLLARQLAAYITAYDHWVAFGLLALIGGNMIRESFSGEAGGGDASVAFKVMLPLALATSIDALASGVTFALLDVSLTAAVLFIGVITFALSCVGVKVGSVFGARFKSKAELTGGVILVLLGVKILLEHLDILTF